MPLIFDGKTSWSGQKVVTLRNGVLHRTAEEIKIDVTRCMCLGVQEFADGIRDEET